MTTQNLSSHLVIVWWALQVSHVGACLEWIPNYTFIEETITHCWENLWWAWEMQIKQQHIFRAPSVLTLLGREDISLLISKMNMEQHKQMLIVNDYRKYRRKIMLHRIGCRHCPYIFVGLWTVISMEITTGYGYRRFTRSNIIWIAITAQYTYGNNISNIDELRTASWSQYHYPVLSTQFRDKAAFFIQKRLRGWKEHKRFLKALMCVKKQVMEPSKSTMELNI